MTMICKWSLWGIQRDLIRKSSIVSSSERMAFLICYSVMLTGSPSRCRVNIPISSKLNPLGALGKTDL